MGWNINKKFGRYTNCKHCIEVDLILMHNQKFSGEARPKVQVRYCHLVPTVVILHPINFHISILFVEYH
jgi:hypothetical protein